MDYTQSRTTDNTSLPPSHCHCTRLQQWTIHSQGLQSTHHCHPVTITAQACNSGLYTVNDYRQHITATQSLSLHKPATVDYTQSRTTDNTPLPPSHCHCTSLQQWTIHNQGLQTTHHCHPVTVTAHACNSGLYTVNDYRQHITGHPVTVTAQACNSGLYTVKDYRQPTTATQSLSLHTPATVDYTQSRTTDNPPLPPSHCHCTRLQQWTMHNQGLQSTHHCHPVTLTAQACNSGLYTIKDYRQHITATQSLSLHKPATVDYTQSMTTDNTSRPPSHCHCTSLQQWTIHSQGLQATHHCHPVTVTAHTCNSGLYTVKDYITATQSLSLHKPATVDYTQSRTSDNTPLPPSHYHCTSLQQWTIHSQGLQTTHHCHPVTVTAHTCNSGLYTVKDYITATQSLSLHKPATQQWTIHSQGLQTTHHCHPVTVTAQACNTTVDYKQSMTTDNTSLPPSHYHCTSLQQWTIHSQGLQATHHCHPVTVTAQACNSGLYTVKDYRQHITATQSLSLHKPATVDYTQSRTTDNTSLPPSHCHCTSLQQWTIHSQRLQTTHHCHPVTVIAQACNSGLYTFKDYRQHITATQSLSLHKPATVDYTQSRTTDNTPLPPSHCHCTSLQQWTIHSQGLQTTHHCHPVTVIAQACNSGLYTVKDYRQHITATQSLSQHKPATVDYTQSRTTDNTSLPPSHYHSTSLQQWTIHSQGLQTTHHCHPVTITAQACNSGLYTVKDYRQHITATQSLSLHKPATVDYTQSRTTDNTPLPPSHNHCTSLQQWTIHIQGLQTTHHCHPVTVTAQACNSGLYTVKDYRQHITATQSLSLHTPATVDYTQSRTTDNTSLPPSHCHCTSLQQWTIHSQGLQTTYHCHPVTITAQACNSGLYTLKDYRQHITATQSLHTPATVDYTQSRTTDNTSLPPSHCHCTSLLMWTIHSQGLQTTHHCHPVTVTAQACNSGLYTVKDYRQHITATQSLSLHKPATVDYTQSRTTDNTSLPPSHCHCTSLQQWTIHSQGLQTTHHCHPVTVTAQACNSGLYTVKDYRQHITATQSLSLHKPATVDYTQSRTTDNTLLPPSHCTRLQQWTIHSQGLQTTHHCHPVTIIAQACNSGLYTFKDYRQHITATQSLSLHKPATVDYTQSRNTDNTSLPPSHYHCTSLQQWTIHSQGLQTTHHCHPVTITAQACNSGLYTVKDYRQHTTATQSLSPHKPATVDYTQSRTTDNTSLPPSHCHCTSLQQWTIHSQGLQTTHHCHPVTITAQACNSGLYTVKDYRQHITATQSLSLHKPATVDYTQSRTTDNTSLPPSHYHCTSLQQWTIHSQGLQTTHHCHPVTVTAQACNSGLYTVKDYRKHTTATQSLHTPATVDYTQSRTSDNAPLPPSHHHCTSLQQWTIHSQGLQTTHHCHPVTVTAQACNSGLYTVKDYRQHITATQSLSLHKPATVDYTQSRTTDNTSLPPSHCHCTSLQQWTIHSQGLQTTHHCHPVTITAQACNSGLYTVKDYRQHITATQSLSLHKPATVDYTQSRTTDNTSLPPSHYPCTSLQQWTIHSQGLQTTHHCHPVTVTAQACNSGLYTVKDYRQHITATQSLSLHKPATVDYTQSRTTDNTPLPPSHCHCTSLQQWTIHSQGLQTTHHCHPVTITAQACNSGLYTVKDYRQHTTATQSLSLHKPATVDYTQSRTTDNTSLPPSHYHCTSLQQWTIHSQGLQTTHHCHPVTVTAQACNSGLYTVKDFRQHTTATQSLSLHKPATVDYTQSRTTDNTSLPPSHCHCTSLQQWTIHSQGLQTTHHCHPVTVTAQACNSGLYTVKDYRQHITATQSLSLHKPETVDYTQSRTTDNTSLPPSHCHCTSLQQWTIHSQGLQTTHHCHPVTVTAHTCNSGLYTVKDYRQHITATQSLSLHKPATVDYTQSRTTDNTPLPPSHNHCTSLQQWTIHIQGLQTTHHCHPVTIPAQACNSGLYTVKDYRQHITATQSLSLHKPATQQWTIHSQGLQTTHHCHPVTVTAQAHPVTITAQACNSGLYTVKDYRQHITATQSHNCTSLQQWTIHSQGIQATHHCHPVTITAQACNSGLYTVKDYRQHITATQSLSLHKPATVDYTQSRTTDNTPLPPSHYHCTSLQQWTIHSQ